jgi:hypothetical protein
MSTITQMLTTYKNKEHSGIDIKKIFQWERQPTVTFHTYLVSRNSFVCMFLACLIQLCLNSAASHIYRNCNIYTFTQSMIISFKKKKSHLVETSETTPPSLRVISFMLILCGPCASLLHSFQSYRKRLALHLFCWNAGRTCFALTAGGRGSQEGTP